MSRVPELLLNQSAVIINPHQLFTWASGIKSPIYCDNRQLLSSAEAIQVITEEFINLIYQNNLSFDLIAGTATAGIPWASFLAYALKKPMIYVRNKPKSHGRQNLIEGRIQPGQKVILIEDLISTGGSAMEAALAIRNSSGEVRSILSLFTYQFEKSIQLFKQNHIQHYSLTHLNAILVRALEKKVLTSTEVQEVKQWRENIHT